MVCWIAIPSRLSVKQILSDFYLVLSSPQSAEGVENLRHTNEIQNSGYLGATIPNTPFSPFDTDKE